LEGGVWIVKNIIVLGDSHGSIYQSEEDQLSFVPLGSVTIYNLLKDDAHSKILRETLDRMDPDKDIPIIVLGEVDCRIHVYLQHKNTGRSILDLVWDTTNKYMKVAEYLLDRGFEMVAHGIPPATIQDNIFNYPFYADLKTRRKINLLYNVALAGACVLTKTPFFNVYTGYADRETGLISKEVSEDGCHISPKTGIIKKFVKWVRKEVEGGI
jgi:hypothetical protein